MNIQSDGFSYIEVVVVLGITSILLTLGSVVLFRSRQHSARTLAVDVLLTDLKGQQTNAMAGLTEGAGARDRYGIKLLPDSYVLFRGSVYNAQDPYNRIISSDEDITYTSTFPDSAIVFEKGSGEIVSFSPGADSIMVISNSAGGQKTIRLNKYGVVVSDN